MLIILREDTLSIDLLLYRGDDHAHHLDHSVEVGPLLWPQRPAALGQVDPLLWAASLERGPEVQRHPPPAQPPPQSKPGTSNQSTGSLCSLGIISCLVLGFFNGVVQG